jgi:hypothetical protein
MVEVRAVTQGFAQDLAAMRSSVDTSLVGGFTQAGSTLDTSLSNALKKGTSGFSDLREAGISALAAIAAQATGVLGTSSGGSSGITSLLSAVSGLPGRATGGPVSPGQAYLVGERGPEVFVPTAAGSIANNAGNSGNRTMNVAINVNAPPAPMRPRPSPDPRARSPAPCAVCWFRTEGNTYGLLARRQTTGAGQRLDPALRPALLDHRLSPPDDGQRHHPRSRCAAHRCHLSARRRSGRADLGQRG